MTYINIAVLAQFCCYAANTCTCTSMPALARAVLTIRDYVAFPTLSPVKGTLIGGHPYEAFAGNVCIV